MTQPLFGGWREKVDTFYIYASLALCHMPHSDTNMDLLGHCPRAAHSLGGRIWHSFRTTWVHTQPGLYERYSSLKAKCDEIFHKVGWLDSLSLGSGTYTCTSGSILISFSLRITAQFSFLFVLF